ncbi:D-alanine/D-alanine ligase [Denitrovibrio acetiphilus DSM 12809]|uniref:D-alanine--D-alanine ligase n=1 Tax=Denitrovibrio acetiphilus (strain DSM 12809 / NBRC 114555 / N2460) TaxID=522772 RepID=D4H2T8_DENA2|nr:D-alanine--D-alanine ligase [Denitrovibrio acetiphilus]ADD68961.1 D-alanine/D-alanine ligase [Denitrovibrio acetiphilus DSM 12809]
MKDKKVAVLYGGMSAEREVSLRSGQAAYDSLVRLGYKTVLIDMDRDVAQKISEAGADVCFIALHGTYGEDGRVQGMLDIIGMPYTGSSYQANMVAFDKLLSKERFIKGGVTTPDYIELNAPKKGMPFECCVIKPARQGSSVGIHIVQNEEEYFSKLEDAFKYDSKVIVEECIKGVELTVSILDGETLPVICIRPKKGVYDYESKYTKGMTEYVFDTGLSASETECVENAAMKAFDVLGCSGYGRADIMYDGRTPYVLEVNTLPGMTETSLLPKAANKAGMSFDNMVEKMLLGAFKDKR